MKGDLAKGAPEKKSKAEHSQLRNEEAYVALP